MADKDRALELARAYNPAEFKMRSMGDIYSDARRAVADKYNAFMGHPVVQAFGEEPLEMTKTMGEAGVELAKMAPDAARAAANYVYENPSKSAGHALEFGSQLITKTPAMVAWGPGGVLSPSEAKASELDPQSAAAEHARQQIMNQEAQMMREGYAGGYCGGGPVVERALHLTSKRAKKAEGGRFTSKAIADAIVPPEETNPVFEQEYPLFNKFLGIVGEYPAQIGNFIADTVTYPGQVYRGEKSVTTRDPETGEQRISDEAIQKALDLSGAAMTGGFGASAVKPPVAGEYSNTLRMFAGPNSKTADLEALASAKEMMKNKVPAEEVRQSTGWELTPHGDWRYEIADNKARLSPEAEYQMSGTYRGEGPSSPDANKNKTYYFGKPKPPAGRPFYEDEMQRYFVEHPELLDAYPEIARTYLKGKFTPERSKSGSFGPDGFEVGAAYPDEALSAAMHEAQHYIQKKEGWPRGSNPQAVKEDLSLALSEQWARTRDNLWNLKQRIVQTEKDTLEWSKLKDQEKRLKAHMKDLDKSLNQDNLRKAAWDEYRKSAGETESRNTEKRLRMTPEERRKTPPEKTQDVPFDDQIVERRLDANGGSIVGKALVLTSKKAASRRGRPD